MSDESILTEGQELGEPIREYRGQGIASRIGKLIGGGIFALGGIGAIGYAIYSLIRNLVDPSADDAFLVLFMPGVTCFIGVAILPIGAWFLRSVYNSLGLRVQAYSEGFAFARRDKTDIFRWDDISELRVVPYVFGSSQARTHYLSYHVQRQDGLKVVLDQADLPDVPVLGQVIEEEVIKQMLPRAMAAFEDGEQLLFGKDKSQLAVSREGIEHGNQTLTWEEIAGITIDIKENRLVIMQRGAPGKKDKRWAKLFLSDIPNAPVLVRLVKQVRSQL